MRPIYLDYNATTPVAPDVAAAMRPYLEEVFGNPSSAHWYGVQARKAVEMARRQVADLLACDAGEIIFTSGGSESNNLAIKGVALARQDRGRHIITSAVEHPAVIQVCHFLEQQGYTVTYLPVDDAGRVRPEDVAAALTPQTILVTIMHANNEVGTLQPLAEIAAVVRPAGALLHTDAAQSVGKIPVRVDDLGVDLLSVAGHKLYAPKGIGALYLRRGVDVVQLIHGADHEQNLRAGTENVLEIVGLGAACALAAREPERLVAHLRAMRDRLHRQLEDRLGKGVRLNGHPDFRLPNTLSLGFAGVAANILLDEIADRVAASAGAACHADEVEVSAVLEAMRVPPEFAMGTIRFSTGRMTTAAEIDQAADVIAAAAERLMSPETEMIAMTEDMDVKLTRYTQGLGCACKIRPQVLERILQDLPVPDDARVLVGAATADDAAVYRLDDETALVVTVDFFTPVVDDPYAFGAIAATNALSDIYAMGAEPLLALNLVGFPTGRLPESVLRTILQGAADKALEAGIPILGGHSVEDTEPKFGLVVVGRVHPDRIWTNRGARPGDALLLTKPLGLGIIATAVKRGLVEPDVAAVATAVMSRLNAAATQVARRHTVHACTDVTGYGLLGHLREMILGGATGVEIVAADVPLLEGVRELVRLDAVPGGTLNNLEFVADMVRWPESLGRTERILLADAQTSGGLLLAVPAAEASALQAELAAAGETAALIGRFFSEKSPLIHVL
ncbi:MAG: selenide, water dikinase SelD [Acidobacteria bacterium]|nr:selenide, water dikinase SelD [Acidobacteriota bacterium]